MFHMFAGLIMTGLGVWGLVTWWDVFGTVMRGVIPFVLVLVGLVALMAGFRRGGTAAEQMVPMSHAPAGPPEPRPAAEPERRA